ncbi:hypothetical protein K2Z83_14655 [Oscillochloris sp. ZM17-4]|uniref:hypothetical protein n=1 Tax=Oscillochloris sp. ZM17-4 TaxID=2866714 RepID=UPI001C72C239|nr:hypothetical protein [Oscillochloris sp. ZM17-4]MBX0328917.1 hypothetical protein [Oscillochloris sp. ZM17-4]
MSGPKQRSEYKVESPNQIIRAGADSQTGGSPSSDQPGAGGDSPEASTQANPAGRPRTQMSRTLLGWIIALVGALGLLALLVMLWATGGLRPAPAQEAGGPARGPLLSSDTPAEGSQGVLGGASGFESPPAPAAEIPAVGTSSPSPVVDPGFQGYYDAHGGLRILGRPISGLMTVNGREIQWFERARVERWPEYAGTPYEIQLGRLGTEYTDGRMFASQQFFVSRPDMRFFAETGHALGGAFLSFWSQNGDLDVFGMPISEEFDEVLPDGKTYRVQYFERARMELHPEAAGTPYEVQSGLLGTALYQNERRPDTIQPVPTAVPLP